LCPQRVSAGTGGKSLAFVHEGPVREETTVPDLRLIPLIRKPVGILRFLIILVVLVMMIAMIGLTGGLVP
jgi:hypothetical protein